MPVDDALTKPYKNLSIQLILNDRPTMNVATASNERLPGQPTSTSTTQNVALSFPGTTGAPNLNQSNQVTLNPTRHLNLNHHGQILNPLNSARQLGIPPQNIETSSALETTPGLIPRQENKQSSLISHHASTSQNSNTSPTSSSISNSNTGNTLILPSHLGSGLPLPIQPSSNSSNMKNQQQPQPHLNHVPPGYTSTSGTSATASATNPSSTYVGHSIPPYYPMQPVQQEFMDVRHGRRFRRRYNQIVRKYRCLYLGCTKSYGSLNHLNTHIVLKKHGQRKSKADFQTQEEPLQNPTQPVWYGYTAGRAQQPQYIGQVAYESGIPPHPYFMQRPATTGWMVEPPILYHHQLVARQMMQPNLATYPNPNSSQQQPAAAAAPPPQSTLKGVQPPLPVGVSPMPIIADAASQVQQQQHHQQPPLPSAHSIPPPIPTNHYHHEPQSYNMPSIMSSNLPHNQGPQLVNETSDPNSHAFDHVNISIKRDV